MPAVWFALKRSLRCKPEPGSVHDPEGDENKTLPHISTKKRVGGRSGCSKSIANLKDVVIPGSKRHTEKPPICSPRSIGSSELMYPITHEVMLNNSTCELKISAFPDGGDRCGGNGDCDVSDYVGMLKPGTPGPGLRQLGRGKKPGILGSSPIRRSASNVSRRSSGFEVIHTRHRSSFGADFHGGLFCHKCGEQFGKWEAIEEHHLSKHAVTDLVEGDSSRRIVEIICRSNTGNNNKNNHVAIDRILKVHSMQKMLAQFEEYRDLVIIKANKLPKKHPRCLADGNELLRFHGTTVECSLGLKGSSSLCTSHNCGVCWILRNGFSTEKELSDGIGVFTASSSSRALESIQESDDNGSTRKALIVCRVIAGRVHRPLENFQELVGQSGFDSLAGKIGHHSNIEELYLLSPRALLPCFLVIYKP